MTSIDPVISLKNVSIYNSNDIDKRLSISQLMQNGNLVLSDINLNIYPGEFVYLMGRVGSGKSSLLKTLYAELPLMIGDGSIAGYQLNGLRERDVPYLRRKMGIVFQDFQLLNDRNAYMNLDYVMRATGWRNESEIKNRIEQVLGLVGLQAKGYRMPHELSGGEQQRLVIARALLNSPDILLADEPTGNLDPVTTKEIMELFIKVTQQGCAVVMSTHNTTLLDSYPARALLFTNGKIKDVNLCEITRE